MIGYNVVGLDTGFFKRLLDGHEQATELFRQITRHELPVFVSCISLYELGKLRHRGVIDHDAADALLNRIPAAFGIVWLDRPALLRRAAGLSHGNDIPMADALILACCLQEGCEVIYTTDPDLTRYDGTDLDVVVLE